MIIKGCLFYLDDMRHRRVGRFVAGASQGSGSENRQVSGRKYYPLGWRFSYPTVRLGFECLHLWNNLSPVTK
ncbi:MAG: hypothetical protein E6767_00530 [Dysgonomonas sp.]|nr:hypothetical protein [Dysgonomonas sp.]